MGCFTDYIGIDRNTTSRSGLYAVDLPSIVLSTLEELTTEDQADYLEFWNVVYSRAISNLVTDVSTALQGKFHVDSKLLARETSEFTSSSNSGSDYAGVLIEFNLPKYARIHVKSVDVNIVNSPSPGDEIRLSVFESDNPSAGNAVDTVFYQYQAGVNSIPIDSDHDSNVIFVGYIPQELQTNPGTPNLAKQTENKFFNSNLVNHKLSCHTCYGEGVYTGTVTQVNGGGVNVHYVVYCSIEKFVCENLNLFKKLLWWKIGEEITIEQIHGEKLNRFTTMTAEGADKRMEFFNGQYTKELNEAIKSQNITEDLVCFRCKNTVESVNSIP